MEQSENNSESIPREEYLRYREALLELRTFQYSSFDKYILTLSSSAIGISLIFIKDIISKSEVVGTVYLHLCWLLLAFAILITLISFLSASSAVNKEIDNWDKQYSEDGNDSNEKELENTFTLMTKILNWVACICFVLGVLLLCLFAGKNL